jgi:autotransporter strand-loop-strand O-heptosyltransferase
MAHREQKDFCLKVKEKFADFFRNKKVLDIGSLDINGNNKDLFENCNYLGLDVGEGKNVDVVSVGHLFDGPDKYYDTIISTEVFEHDMFYEDTIKNIMRMLKPGGLFLFTCAAPGRPEHGTRRCGEECAPLLIQISESWADYYKNLEESHIRKIENFNQTFPDCYFEVNNDCYIPSDLYFYGIKGGENFLIDSTIIKHRKEDFIDHVFVIDSWIDTPSKENDLINLIKRLKTFNITIVLTGHYPIKSEIQNMVDYYIFDKNNPLLLFEEFEKYDLTGVRWSSLGDQKIENSMNFHHDYAIWESMRNAFNFCDYLGKKYIHFFEYDNLPDEYQYRQSFLEKITNYDAILYEYRDKDHVNNDNIFDLCATFIFSIKTDIALKLISKVKSRDEYFSNRNAGWPLEILFFNILKKVTKNYFITEYIDCDSKLNTQAVWNRDGIDRNGDKYQIYLASDLDQNLYLHLISGFQTFEADGDYLLEYEYDGESNFLTLTKGSMIIHKIGKYKKGYRVKVYSRGLEVFNEYLALPFIDFYKRNKYFSNTFQKTFEPESIKLNFIDGPYFEIIDDNKLDRTFEVEFFDNKDGKLVYNTRLKSGWWCRPNLKYFVDWKIKINSDQYHEEYNLDLKNKRVFITFESKSLGDNLAWIPYVELFREKHGCKIICSTFLNELFKGEYVDIEFVEPGSVVNNIHALYRIGLFFNNDKFDENLHPTDPTKVPLGKIASDILGLDYVEKKPILPKLGRKKFRRICIATHTTAQCKYWNNPNGWQEVVDYLNNKGYEVRLLSREEDGYMGNKNPNGVVQQPKSTIPVILKTIQESELFIGISSGLSWLSWGSGTPTIIISGWTDDKIEPQKDISRIINKDVCHGCWSTHKFDPGDWNWCPLHKGTEREFECSKSITSNDVIKEINTILF